MIWLLIFILFWSVAFYKHQKKTRYFGAGSLALFLYLLYAIVSLIYYFTIGKSYKPELSLFPFVYLFVLILIASAPILRYNEKKVKVIKKPSEFIVDSFSVLYLISAIFVLPSIVMNMQSGITLLLVDVDAGADLYNETKMNAVESVVGGGIANPFLVFFNIFSDVAILLFFYYIAFYPQKKYYIIAYALSIIVQILDPISRGGRTTATIVVFTVIIAFVTMRKFLTDSLKRKFLTIFGSLFLFVGLLFFSISIARFGTTDSAMEAGTLSYIGQGNLNFNEYVMNAGGTRNGDRTANTFKRLLGMETTNGIPSTRAKYSNLKIDDSVFYTFVGDFVLDYGPIVTPILFVIFSLFLCSITKMSKGVIGMHQLVALFFCMCVVIQGGFYLFTYSFNGNLKIIAFILIYVVFYMDIQGKKKKLILK